MNKVLYSFFSLENKIVYGTGMIDPSVILEGSPRNIISVRGPKTRAVLLEQGYKCPDKYGDPALLLPIFYKPNIKEKQGGCLILNMGTKDIDHKIISDIKKLLNLKIISMTNYDKWTDVIDEIVNSEFVISESLHGLIVAETYCVPNVWVEFKEHPKHWNFKFEDYYESIGRHETILSLHKCFDIKIINEKISNWKKGSINYKELLELFPFEIVCEIN